MIGDEIANPVGSGEQFTTSPLLDQPKVLVNGAVGISINFYAR